MLNVLDEAMKDSKNEENQTVIRWVISKRLKLMALGEVEAFSRMLRAGSRYEDIKCLSIDANGRRKKPCLNCASWLP